MKAIICISVLLFATLALAAEDYCYKDVVEACKTTTKKSVTALNCTAKYGAIDNLQSKLQRYVNHHFIRSFEYLLMATHFGNYEKNREGFEKLFRGLSDNKWHEAIELIKYITKRGGEMNFNELSEGIRDEDKEEQDFELLELSSVAKALDIEKKLALEAFQIHEDASRKMNGFHDPEISSHVEHEFVHKQRDIVRKLAGYTTDLSELLNGPDASLSLYLFDEYLQKQ
nr:unnamed protein product [Callosobruchus analis]